MQSLRNYEERQEEERNELERRRKRLLAIAEGIVKLDGLKGFTALNWKEEYEPRVDLEGADGRRIYLSTTRHEKVPRLHVAGKYPQDARGTYIQVKDAPRISVALDRDIADIGKDIARRFLPDYQAKFNEVAGQVKARNEHRAKLVAVGTRLAARLQARFDPDRVDHEVHISEYRPERIAVRTYDGERFSLDIELTSEAALNQILDILQPRKEGH